MYVADGYRPRILKISPDGMVTPYAGNATHGYRGSGIKATEAGIGSVVAPFVRSPLECLP